jgi:hypothetical protein
MGHPAGALIRVMRKSKSPLLAQRTREKWGTLMSLMLDSKVELRSTDSRGRLFPHKIRILS